MAKQNIKFKPSMCDKVRELGKLGKTVTQIAAELGVTRDTLYRWRKNSDLAPGFKAACADAKTFCEAHWTQVGMDGMQGKIKGFNQISWIFFMKAVFKDNWHETTKSEVTMKSEHETLTDEQLENLIATKNNVVGIKDKRDELTGS